jgi:hypothetical protein
LDQSQAAPGVNAAGRGQYRKAYAMLKSALTSPDQRSHKHLLTLHHEVASDCPAPRVFHFLTREIEAHYRALSPAHHYFRVRGGGPLVLGSIADCSERAGNQEVRHTYRVHEWIEPTRLVLVSSPSQTKVHLKRRVIEGTSMTRVVYTLRPLPAGGTQLRLDLTIGFDSWWNKGLALLGGTRSLWQRHLAEELDHLVLHLDKELREPLRGVPVSPRLDLPLTGTG